MKPNSVPVSLCLVLVFPFLVGAFIVVQVCIDRLQIKFSMFPLILRCSFSYGLLLQVGYLYESSICGLSSNQIHDTCVSHAFGLSASWSPDLFIWSLSQNGRYTVSSGHKVALSIKFPQLNPLRVANWRRIWDLKISPKYKFNVWRIGHNILPTVDNLLTRGMNIPNCCYVCSENDDCGIHVLKNCVWARDVWHALNLDQLVISSANSIESWLDEILDLQNDQLLTRVCIALLEIWKNRNSCYFDGRCATVYSMVRKIQALCRMELEAENSGPAISLRAEETWSPPPVNFRKLNCDANFKRMEDLAGIGGVCRDHRGLIRWAFAKRESYCQDAFHAEALSILEALVVARSIGETHLVVESDCLAVIKEIWKSTSSFSSSSIVIDEIKSEASKFTYCLFSHVKRSGNVVAHSLAHF